MCFWHERNPLSDALQYQSFSFRHESASWKRMMKVCLWSRSENAFALTTIKILLTTVHPPLITVPNCIFDWSIISSIAILPFQWMLTYFNVFKWKHKFITCNWWPAWRLTMLCNQKLSKFIHWAVLDKFLWHLGLLIDLLWFHSILKSFKLQTLLSILWFISCQFNRVQFISIA